MTLLLLIIVLVLLAAYCISRSWIKSLNGLVDDRSYNTACAVLSIQLVTALGVGVMEIAFAFISPVARATTGSALYGGVGGTFFAAFVAYRIIKDYIRVAEAHEAYIREQKLNEIESRPGEAEKRALHRRELTKCDPKTEWRCPICKSVNSNYVGTCGCGCRKDEVE